MVIIKLIGGLGNQMFQYAAGRRTAITNKTELKLDITGYDNQVGITPRAYLLYIFNIHASIATKEEIHLFHYYTKNRVQRNFYRIMRAIFQRHYILQKTTLFTYDFLHIPNNSYLDGYWGSEKHFVDIQDIIRRDFTLKNKPDKTNMAMLTRTSTCNSVSIHVRRSDYVKDKKTHDFHGVCGLDYYKKAISFITKQTVNPHFFIFSDDPNWCKANFRLRYPATYVTHNLGKKDCEDMRLMSACTHNIIANSSFSWWSAWLNINPDKIVIAPKRWFKDSSINSQDIVPKTWIQL